MSGTEPLSWDELRAGCPMVSCEGDQAADPLASLLPPVPPAGLTRSPRCYCEHQAWCSARAETARVFDWSVTSEVTYGIVATEEPGRVTLLARIYDRQEEARLTAGIAAGTASEQDKIDAYFRGEPPPVPGPPATGVWEAGQAAVGRDAASWWVCTDGGTPGAWVQLLPLAEARRRWISGDLPLAGFRAALDRADLPELDRLPGAPWRRPWWKRWWLRVIRAVAGLRRVM